MPHSPPQHPLRCRSLCSLSRSISSCFRWSQPCPRRAGHVPPRMSGWCSTWGQTCSSSAARRNPSIWCYALRSTSSPRSGLLPLPGAPVELCVVLASLSLWIRSPTPASGSSSLGPSSSPCPPSSSFLSGLRSLDAPWLGCLPHAMLNSRRQRYTRDDHERTGPLSPLRAALGAGYVCALDDHRRYTTGDAHAGTPGTYLCCRRGTHASRRAPPRPATRQCPRRLEWLSCRCAPLWPGRVAVVEGTRGA